MKYLTKFNEEVKVGSDQDFNTKEVIKINELETAEDFYNNLKDNYSIEECMQMYAKHVSVKFDAEVLFKSLGKKGKLPSELLSKIEHMYNSIEW